MNVTRAQVLAYRVARHGLHRDNAPTVLDLGVQDAGNGSPLVALAARGLDPDDSLTTVWTFRGAPHLMRRTDVPALAKALWPRSETDALARLSGAGTVFKKAGVSGLTAFTDAAHAMHDVVTTEITRGDVSTEVTRRLPAEYSYDCRTCEATHIYGSLFQLVGLAAGVEVLGQTRPTRLRPLANRHPVPKATTGAAPAIVDYLRLHGPATVAEVAAFLETTRKEATAMWPDGLAEVTVDGRAAFLPESDVDTLRSAPDPDPVRLLPPLDPFLQARDRDLLVPDPAHRKALWRIIGNPGAVLAGGEIVGTWRAKAGGRKLAITVEPFTKLTRATQKAAETEAQVAAAARGYDEAKFAVTIS
ncbi:winged helix DNA-binding domain-containing protein [Actinokineospora sp. HUAS TT18]|uniref:winged helix DNA-binding domain-containing protein n=1 Tax=Actinokineospora sp. HUAS TT18 TaxID=3447451 RepID=UPI003F51DAC3